MDRSQPAATNLLDQQQRLIAQVLQHFRTLCILATAQADSSQRADPSATAVSGMSMQLEFDGLHTCIKDLLTLSRRLKELWLFGPLADPSADPAQQARVARLREDVVATARRLVSLRDESMRKAAEEAGGSWEGADGPGGAGAPATGEPMIKEEEGQGVVA